MFFNGGIFCVGLLLIFSIGLKCENSETKSPNERTIIRLLSKYFTPKSYDVRLQSIVESENIVSFKGNVQIEILCLKSFDYIRLNAYKTDIYLSSVQVFERKSNTKIVHDADLENVATHAIFNIRASFLAGNWYTISLDFLTRVNENFRGLHKISYTQDGVAKYLITTQSKPIESRRIFPCFDEPDYFIPLNLSIARPKNMVSISNAPLALSTSALPGYVWDHYFPLQDPLALAPYSISLVITDFPVVPIDWNDGRKRKLSVHVRHDFVKYIGLVGENAGKLLIFFERYFHLEFPISKLDFVAVPEMAHGFDDSGFLGLAIFRESNFLFDADRSTVLDKQYVLKSLARSIANQWVGTYVNIKWWNNTWETEALLNYLQYFAIESTYGISDLFAVTVFQEAQATDALLNVESITTNPTVIQDIYAKFSSLISNKGASLMRMSEAIVGKETFARSILRFITSAKSTSFWQILQTQVNTEKLLLPFNIQEVMNEWTNKSGYPLLFVKRSYNNENLAVLTQQAFTMNVNPINKETLRWTVPFSYTFNFFNIYNDTLANKAASMKIYLQGDQNKPVYFNVLSTGYYRVVYDDTNYEKIRAQLLQNHTGIPPVYRAQIMDDALNVAKTGLLQYSTALSLTQYLKFERGLVPWMAADRALGYLDDMLQGTSFKDDWKEYLQSLLENFYDDLQKSEVSSDENLLLQAIIGYWMCVRLEDSKCVNHARSLFSAARENLPPNLRFVTVCTVIAQGGENEWSFALERYRDQSLLTSERLEYLKALGCSKNATHLARALEMIIGPTELDSKGDRIALFKAIALNKMGNGMAIDFFIERWNELFQAFDDFLTLSAEPLAVLFRFLCDQINDSVRLNKIVRFYDSNAAWELMHQSQEVRQGLEIAKFNVDWMATHQDSIKNWLSSSSNSTSSLYTSAMLIIVVSMVIGIFQ